MIRASQVELREALKVALQDAKSMFDDGLLNEQEYIDLKQHELRKYKEAISTPTVPLPEHAEFLTPPRQSAATMATTTTNAMPENGGRLYPHPIRPIMKNTLERRREEAVTRPDDDDEHLYTGPRLRNATTINAVDRPRPGTITGHKNNDLGSTKYQDEQENQRSEDHHHMDTAVHCTTSDARTDDASIDQTYKGNDRQCEDHEDFPITNGPGVRHVEYQTDITAPAARRGSPVQVSGSEPTTIEPHIYERLTTPLIFRRKPATSRRVVAVRYNDVERVAPSKS